MSYTVIITEEIAANVAVTTQNYPITIEYNATNISNGSTYGNANVESLLASGSNIAISTTGNVTAAYFVGNGSQLTGLPEAYGNANVEVLLASGVLTGNIVTSGDGEFGNVVSNGLVFASGNVVGSNVIGNGQYLTNVPGANVTGTVANATYATTAGSATTATTAGTANIALVAYSVNAANVSGTVANAAYSDASGTATTAGTANIALVANSVAGANVSGAVAQATQADTANIASVAYSVSAANVSGTVANAAYADNAGSATTANSVAGANVSGTVALANAAVYLRDASNAASTMSISDTNKAVFMPGGGLITWSGDGVDANTVGSFNMIPGGPIANSFASLSSVNTANPFANPVNSLGARQTGVSMSYDVYGTHGGSKTLTMDGNGLSTNAVLSSTGNIVTTGNVSGTYILGDGSALTNLPTTLPAGSDNQIQYNDSGAFGGDSRLTFNDATGNIGLGNVVVNADNIRNVNAINLSTTPSPQRITIGSGYDGNFGSNVDPISISRGGTLAVIDKYNIGNSDTNMAQRSVTSTLYADMGGATLTNNGRRLQPLQGALYIGNGTQQITSGPVYATATGLGGFVAAGNITIGANKVDMGGPTTVSHMAGAQFSLATGGDATVGNAVGALSFIQPLTNVSSTTNSAIGFASYFGGTLTSTTAPTNVYGFYMPGTTAPHGMNNANNWRRADNYYFLVNEDDAAQNRLGSLRRYHEFNGVSATTSGDLTIDKNAGQVQQVNLGGNITSVAFSNFVSSASDGTNTDEQCDTVTVAFNQGATGGYGVTFPTGSTYKYAGNVTALQGTTANSVSLVSVSALRLGGTTTYLITISPEFV